MVMTMYWVKPLKWMRDKQNKQKIHCQRYLSLSSIIENRIESSRVDSAHVMTHTLKQKICVRSNDENQK